MTAIFYADCEAASRNGKYTLEARSPHNGTINHKDGRPPSEDEYGFKYRDHQSEFRYRLIDNTRSGSVVWRGGRNEARTHRMRLWFLMRAGRS